MGSGNLALEILTPDSWLLTPACYSESMKTR